MNTMRTMMAVAAFALAIGNVQAGTKHAANAPTAAVKANQGPNPAQARAAVLAFIHATFFDPYSVQDLTIGVPFWNTKATTHHDSVIPFACNAKNRMGGYVGIHQQAIMWKDGALDWAATQDYYNWQDFIEGMRQGPQ